MAHWVEVLLLLQIGALAQDAYRFAVHFSAASKIASPVIINTKVIWRAFMDGLQSLARAWFHHSAICCTYLLNKTAGGFDENLVAEERSGIETHPSFQRCARRNGADPCAT